MIKATENLHIGDLISRRVPFVVPKYQRPYAWEEEEIKDFIRDLSELYKIRVDDPSRFQTHFFGGIVSVDRAAPNTFTGRVFDVVDGQQRLATVMLTISLLVKGLEQLASQATNSGEQRTAQTAISHADTIKESYLEYKEVVSSRTQSRIRLRLSRIDETFFEALIKNGNSDGNGQLASQARQRVSQERLLKAWGLIQQQLIQPILTNAALNFSQKLDHFLALRSAITEDCYIIHIVSDNVNEAFRLFAILNDRGKSLSEADLLRVHTLELLEDYPGEQDQVEQCWDEMLGIKETELEQFLRAYYPSYLGERAPSGDFADHFKKQFFNYRLPVQLNEAVELKMRTARMRDESRVFLDISSGQWPFETSRVFGWERDRLSHLIKVLKHTLCIPLLLSAYQCLPEAEFSRLVGLLERFVFRYITMVGAHAGRLGEVYYKYAKGLRQNQSALDVTSLQTELATLQRNNAPDGLFEEAMKQKLVYSSSMRSGIRYFLTTIEYYLSWYNRGAHGQPSPETTRTFEINQVSLEHIYPQKPTTSDPLLDPFKHDIGNLTFWGPSDNSSATNTPFATKKALYGDSMVRLNQELATLPAWDMRALEQRRQRLIEVAKSVFTL